MTDTIFPHTIVINHYSLQNKKMGKENDQTIQKLNELEKKAQADELDSDELKDALKESRLFASMLLQRFSDLDEKDVQNYREEKKKIQEVKKEVQETIEEVNEQIESLKKLEEVEQEAEEVEEEVVPPPPTNKDEKIKAIIDFFEDNSEATEEDLYELGLKNMKSANEIILIPDKYKIVRKGEDSFVLKKKSNNIFGWIMLGAGAVLAAILGYNSIKKNS